MQSQWVLPENSRASAPARAAGISWPEALKQQKRAYDSRSDPNSGSVEVWATYLAMKIKRLIEKEVTEACIAADLPKPLAQKLVEQLQCGGARFFSWVVDALVTNFMFSDPGAVHERLAACLRKYMNRAMEEVPGDWSDINMRDSGSEIHEIQSPHGTFWKEADATFKHAQKAKITAEMSQKTDVVFEVAVKHESAPKCLEESVWWTSGDCSTVCFVIKVYLQKSATDNWLKPYISAFLAAREASGLVMRGPVELGAYSGCLGRGRQGCILNISSEAFTRGISDTLPQRVFQIDFFNCIEPLFADLSLDFDSSSSLPPQRPNPLSLTVLEDFAQTNGYTLNPPLTRSTLAWFS